MLAAYIKWIGAFNAAVRPLVLTVAAASKVTFIPLVLSNGDRYLRRQGRHVNRR